MTTNTPAPAPQETGAHDLHTSEGARAYVAEYFATQIGRHDFKRYIANTLAADFACALAQHLSKLRAPVADIRHELNQLGMTAHTAMHQDARDMRNIMEDLAERLLAMAGGAALASAPVVGEARPHIMSLGEILAEYRKGCTNTGGEGPENCPDCVRAFVSALEALNVCQASAPVADQHPRLRPPLSRIAGVSEDILRRGALAAVRATDERERGYAENAAFRIWWDENQACPEHSLTTENAAHAAWQERGRRAALASAPVAGEALARYCPGCGSVGPVGDEYRDCCPDGNQARMIPARLAEQCRDTFRLAIKSLLADAAANDSAPPQASTTRPAPSDIELYACFSADLGCGGKWLLEGARLVLDRYRQAAPQASEAVRILFPTHLRKMWSGGEVQAWLDAHQGVTAPRPSAKGSLQRYRKWQAEQVTEADALHQADKDSAVEATKRLPEITTSKPHGGPAWPDL